MDLEEAADELYGVVPQDFVAARKELAGRARDDGDRGLATAIGGLPKPSTAAWLSNVLVRHHREEIEGLIELGGLLREAQSSLAGDQLRALNNQRGRLLSALTRQASSLARERGHPVSSAVAGQVEETLRAALADPEAGEAVLSGRLTSPLSYSGGLDVGAAVARPELKLLRPKPAPAKDRPKPDRTKTDRRKRDRDRAEEQRRAEEERRRRELDEARTAAEEAAAAAREAGSAARAERERADELENRRDEQQARLDALTEQLTRLREELGAGEADLARAQRRARTAERRAREAESAEEHARAKLAELEA